MVRLTFRTEPSHVVLARTGTGAVIFIPVSKIKRTFLNSTNNSHSVLKAQTFMEKANHKANKLSIYQLKPSLHNNINKLQIITTIQLSNMFRPYSAIIRLTKQWS